jgi:hypothetical protein
MMLNDSIALGKLVKFVDGLNGLFGSDIRLYVMVRVGAGDDPQVIDLLERVLYGVGLPFAVVRSCEQESAELPAASMPAATLEEPAAIKPAELVAPGALEGGAAVTKKKMGRPKKTETALARVEAVYALESAAAPGAPEIGTNGDSLPADLVAAAGGSDTKVFEVDGETFTRKDFGGALRTRLLVGARVRSLTDGSMFEVTAKRSLRRVGGGHGAQSAG